MILLTIFFSLLEFVIFDYNTIEYKRLDNNDDFIVIFAVLECQTTGTWDEMF